MIKWSIKTKSGKGRILAEVKKQPGIHVNAIGNSSRIRENVEILIISGFIYSVLELGCKGGIQKKLFLTDKGQSRLDSILQA